MGVPTIQSALFMKSAVKASQYPDHDIPEIAFAGRSNVGKSSLINTLLNRKKLVKTSSTPGRTQTLNFFLVNQTICFVDLPGYGYAKVPKSLKKRWGPMISSYVGYRANLRGVVLILDIRRKPTPDDLQLFQTLIEHAVPTLIVATKIDKLTRSKRTHALKDIGNSLGIDALPIPFSARTREGRNDIWEAITALLATSS